MIQKPHARPDNRENASRLADSYTLCRSLARTHYENFPVGSYLAPRSLRKHVHAVYAFARGADDIADEGNAAAADRLRRLDRWQAELDRCYNGTPSEPTFHALADTIRRFSLPRGDFEDLLAAFRMDVTTDRFERYQDLLYYSARSANPIGRLVLSIFGCRNDACVGLSDHLCTALQLTNFWQDVRVDIRNGRRYIPLEDCARFGYPADAMRKEMFNESFRDLLAFEVRRTRGLFLSARALPGQVPFRLGLELRATWIGGMTVLDRIEQSGYNVFRDRPVLRTADILRIGFRSLSGLRV